MKEQPRRVLVNVFHPDLPGSRVNRAWADAAHDAGFLVRDVAGRYPDFRIEVAEEQAHAEAADVLVFQHPLHWYAPPAIMKRWIDQVLAYGWAYGGPDRLAGKPWLSAVSVGAGREEYGADGSRGHTIPEFLRPIEHTAKFCHMPFGEPFLLYGAGYVPDGDVRESASRYVRWLQALAEGKTAGEAVTSPADAMA